MLYTRLFVFLLVYGPPRDLHVLTHSSPTLRPSALPPQLRAQPQYARRQEVRQRRLDVLQAAHMGDVARSLDREHEAVRGLVAPAGEAVGLQEAIEGAVDLYRREAPGGKAKLAL